MKVTADHRKRPAPAGPRPAQADAPLAPLLRLQRTVGNAAVQRLLAQREGDAPASLAPSVERGIGAARGGGAGLDGGARERMETAFGADFGGVRVHTGAEAGTLSRSLGARAFTTGRDVFFAQGEYRPGTEGGDRLIAHELAHVVQQGGRAGAGPLTVGAPGDAHEREADAAAHAVTSGARAGVEGAASGGAVQRDLTAYWRDHTDFLPGGGASVPSLTYRASAGSLRAALAGLIAAGKVAERRDSTQIFFSESGATQTELENAFNTASIPRAADLARALLNHTDTYLYSREKSSDVTIMFWTTNVGRTPDVVERQTSRPLTGFERSQAALVFAGGLDVSRIRVAEDPVFSIGGYARTLPNGIHFPMGSMGSPNYLPWLIHELTHSWQYQHGVGLPTTGWHAVMSTYDYGGEAGLQAATAAGRHFSDFNTEQQGDIIRDYYRALVAGRSTAAFDPFVAEVRVP